MITINTRSWRYRAWAYTYLGDDPPRRTSLCAMFWRTVTCWGLLFPVVAAIGIGVAPFYGVGWTCRRINRGWPTVGRIAERIVVGTLATVALTGTALLAHQAWLHWDWPQVLQGLIAVAITPVSLRAGGGFYRSFTALAVL